MPKGVYKRKGHSPLKGRERPKKVCEKISLSNKGKTPWNKGLKNVNGNCGRKKGSIPWNKGKTNIELYGIIKAKILEESNRQQAIKNYNSKPTEDTNIERKIENYFLFNDILYVKQHSYKYGIADFWLPETNTIIECDGDYWHSIPLNKRRDYLQTRWLIENQYNVIRLKECDIMNNFDFCVNKIENALV